MKVQQQMNLEALIDDYFQTLNELDETQRIELIQKVWAADGIFVSPVGKAQSHQESQDLIAAFYESSPGTTVRRVGEIETLHRDYLRFSFEVIQPDGTVHVSGTDFAIIKNGKLQLVAGFFNSAPHNTAGLKQQEIIEIVKQVYQAFNASDIAMWLTFFAPTFEWYAADNSPIADRSPYRGLDTVCGEVLPRLATLFPGMQLRADEILATENKAVMLGYYHNLPQKAGGTTEAQVAHILTFQNGKIVKFQQYLDTYKFASL
jgi:uncharacterized protein